MTRSRRVATASGALAIFALLPASAWAGVAQKEYACYGESNTYIATLQIKSATKYSYLGESGKYQYHSGGKVLEFTKGPLVKWVGHYYKLSGAPAIDIITKQAGGQTVNCDS